MTSYIISKENIKYYYHGTDTQHLEQIRKDKAILPNCKHIGHINFDTMSDNKSIYLTTVFEDAIKWARESATRSCRGYGAWLMGDNRDNEIESKIIVLRIPKEAIDESLLQKDVNMKTDSSLAYRGKAITQFKVIRQKDFGKEFDKWFRQTKAIDTHMISMTEFCNIGEESFKAK